MKYFPLALLFSLSTHAALSIQADLKSPSLNELKARVSATEVKGGVKFVTEVSGLTPGAVHGIHIHERGKCEGPDFKSAGDHFNPSQSHHGGPAASLKHEGDLGNVVADRKGVARSEVVIQKKNPGEYSGKSVILHAKADDMKTQPSGDSGDRIACGILH